MPDGLVQGAGHAIAAHTGAHTSTDASAHAGAASADAAYAGTHASFHAGTHPGAYTGTHTSTGRGLLSDQPGLRPVLRGSVGAWLVPSNVVRVEGGLHDAIAAHAGDGGTDSAAHAGTGASLHASAHAGARCGRMRAS